MWDYGLVLMEDAIRVALMKVVHACSGADMFPCPVSMISLEVSMMLPRMNIPWICSVAGACSLQDSLTAQIHCILPLKPYVGSYDPTPLQES